MERGKQWIPWRRSSDMDGPRLPPQPPQPSVASFRLVADFRYLVDYLHHDVPAAAHTHAHTYRFIMTVTPLSATSSSDGSHGLVDTNVTRPPRTKRSCTMCESVRGASGLAGWLHCAAMKQRRSASHVYISS